MYQEICVRKDLDEHEKEEFCSRVPSCKDCEFFKIIKIEEKRGE